MTTLTAFGIPAQVSIGAIRLPGAEPTALLLPMLPMLLDPGDPAGVVFASAPTAARTAWLYGVLLAGYAFAMMIWQPTGWSYEPWDGGGR